MTGLATTVVEVIQKSVTIRTQTALHFSSVKYVSTIPKYIKLPGTPKAQLSASNHFQYYFSTFH